MIDNRKDGIIGHCQNKLTQADLLNIDQWGSGRLGVGVVNLMRTTCKDPQVRAFRPQAAAIRPGRPSGSA